MIFNTLDVELKENKMAKCDPFDCVIIEYNFIFVFTFIYLYSVNWKKIVITKDCVEVW